MSVVLYGTWPQHATGYGKIMFNMIAILSEAGYDVHVYGIQRSDKLQARELEGNTGVVLHEVKRTQNDPHAFGIEEFGEFVDRIQPSVVLVYNSPYVMLHALSRIQNVHCKKIAYLDLVYSNPPIEYLQQIFNLSTDIAVFTPKMAEQVQDILACSPTRLHVVRHGCNTDADPVGSRLARQRLADSLLQGIPDNSFIVLNLNRNIPRKRLDLFVCAAAIVLDNIRNRTPLISHRPIIFIMNSQHEFCHNLFDIFAYECKDYRLPEFARNHMMIVLESQSDDTIKLLMEAADVGVTCSDGEGWGLCSHEHAAKGVPQIVSPVGIFPEMFAEGGAKFLTPLTYTYDGVKEGGKQLVCCPKQLAAEILSLYDMSEPELSQMSDRAQKAAIKYSVAQMAKDLLACVGDAVYYKTP